MARRSKKPEKSEAQKLADAYWSCFTTPAGAIVLADLKAKVQDRTVIPAYGTNNDIPVNAVLVNEGGRRLYLYMTSMMEEAQKDYATGGTATARTNGTTVITTDGPDYEPGDDIDPFT